MKMVYGYLSQDFNTGLFTVHLSNDRLKSMDNQKFYRSIDHKAAPSKMVDLFERSIDSIGAHWNEYNTQCQLIYEHDQVSDVCVKFFELFREYIV